MAIRTSERFPGMVEVSCSDITRELLKRGHSCRAFMIRQREPTKSEDGCYFVRFALDHYDPDDAEAAQEDLMELVPLMGSIVDDEGFVISAVGFVPQLMAESVLGPYS